MKKQRKQAPMPTRQACINKITHKRGNETGSQSSKPDAVAELEGRPGTKMIRSTYIETRQQVRRQPCFPTRQPHNSLTLTVVQPHTRRTSAVLHLYFGRTPSILPTYFGRTQAGLQPYVSPTYLSSTSAILKPYYSSTNTHLQAYFNRTAAHFNRT